MALTLFFHPLSSYCHKVLIALYENGTAFTPHIVNLGDTQERAAFVALWPTAKIPLLRDDAMAHVVPETSIMIEYLDRHHPGSNPLLPTHEQRRLEARLWDRLFDLYVMNPMQKIVATHFGAMTADARSKAVVDATATLRTSYDMIERQVAERTWAAGESFSMADCSAAPALFYASIVAPLPDSHRNLAAYFERLMNRPSVQRVIDEARPYFPMFPLKDSIPERFWHSSAA